MKDRVPVNPGRVRIVPENGSAAFYATMERADNPTQEGTPLNKNSLLKDTTAALFGLDENAVPDDVLGVLSRLHSGLGNEYVWAKMGEPTAIMGEMKDAILSVSSQTQITVQYSASVEVVGGKIQLVNPQTKTFKAGSYPDYVDDVIGKYANITSDAGADYSCFGLIDSFGYPNNKMCAYYYELTIPTSYVNSPNPNAYPPAEDDGFIYTALGMLGEKVRIATGSYTGTNAYGKSNPNSLTLPFIPKAIFITSSNYAAMFIQGDPYGYSMNGSKSVNILEWTTTVKWYHSSSAAYQMNNGVTYYYVAIS